MEVQDIFSVLQHHRLCYQFGYTKYTSWYYMGDMMSLISYKSYHVTHMIWFRWNEYNTDWLWQSSHQFFGNHYQNKCTNKHRFRRVAWKGQFLVNKPIGQNYCFNGREGYSHHQERYYGARRIQSLLRNLLSCRAINYTVYTTDWMGPYGPLSFL